MVTLLRAGLLISNPTQKTSAAIPRGTAADRQTYQ